VGVREADLWGVYVGVEEQKFTQMNHFVSESGELGGSDFDQGVDFQEEMAGLLRNRPDFIPLALLGWVVILEILVWVLMLGIYLFVNRKADETPMSEVSIFPKHRLH
jgi:hypothetical protein